MRSNISPELVVKEVNGSGGYGMLDRSACGSRDQRSTLRRKLRHDPDNYIAQPTLALSTCPASFAEGIAPRHVDLQSFGSDRPDRVRVVPGGLTRVALKRGLACRQFKPGRRYQGYLDRRG